MAFYLGTTIYISNVYYYFSKLNLEDGKELELQVSSLGITGRS